MASREAISKMTRDVFGQLPNLNTRSGYQHLKKRLIGAISARYYPDPIDKYAKMVRNKKSINIFLFILFIYAYLT